MRDKELEITPAASPVAGGSAEKCENCGHTRREHTLAGRRLIDNCMCCANPSFKLAQPSAEGWVKVTPETMPPEGEPVLVFSRYWSANPFVARWSHGEWEGEQILSRPSSVTHWSKLPAPPAAEEERSSL